MVLKEIKNREEKEAKEKALRNGRPGHGEKKNGYKWWCKGCHTEFFIDFEDNKSRRAKPAERSGGCWCSVVP